MRRLAELPDDMVFFTQITMEAAEDPEFLDAMQQGAHQGRARRRRVGHAGRAEGRPQGRSTPPATHLVDRLRAFKHHGVHVLGSFIFGLPSDRASTFDATVDVAQRAGVTFAQFVMLTPFPGTIDFAAWEKAMETDPTRIDGDAADTPLADSRRRCGRRSTRRIRRCRPTTSGAARRARGIASTASANIWERSHCVKSLKSRLAFVLISKLYRQMYANTGIATDSARVGRSAHWARWIAKPCRRLFTARPMPELTIPA